MTMRATVSTIAILAASGLSLGAPARAADLGGDCCADLETRVAELESTTVRKGNKKVSLAISGRIHANLMWWSETSNGLDSAHPLDQHSDVYVGNQAGSDNRIEFNGNAKISSDITAGFSMIVTDAFSPADTQDTHQGTTSIGTDTTYVFLRSARWGEYRLGNLPSASDDAYYIDFGGPGTVGGLSGGRFAGTFRLRSLATPGQFKDVVSYGHVLGELGDSNENRLMYISPSWNGFTYKSDIGGDDTASASLTWTGTHGTWNGAASAGYEVSRRIDGQSPGGGQSVQSASTVTAPLTNAANDTLRQFAVSASILESNSGLFVTGEYSRAYAAIAGRQDATNWFARAGWTKNATGLGATTIDVQYERTDAKLANDTSGQLWGAGIDQAIDSAASNVYLHYQHDSVDANAAADIAAQSIDTLTGGMIVHF